ncbi:MAG: multidrug efflux pump subunit AcrA (membrane-fusion protein) [Bacteroidia bacterium]|jgi:multidrug efflux pump subunit AcrA (membrane-fusion protein)
MSKPQFNKNLVRSIILGAGIILLGWLIQVLLSKKNDKAGPNISFQSKVVETTAATPATIVINIAVSGRLKATNRIELFAEVTGILENQDFNAGQSFSRGQNIASIDDSEYRAQLIAARSTFMGLISQSLADISMDYPAEASKWKNFLQEIKPNQNLPKLPSADNRQLKQFLSGRNILGNYYTIQSQEIRLNKYRISAPYSGTLSETAIDPGTLVRAGQKMGTFVQQGSYELEAAVTRNDLNFLKKGSKVTLKSAELDQEYIGTVSRINSTINPTTQQVSVFLTVRGKDLKEGLYLDAVINAGIAKDAIVVDRNMLRDGQSIYTVSEKDSTLRVMTIEVISFSEDKAIIKGIASGVLLPKDQINGAFEGMKVVPQESK